MASNARAAQRRLNRNSTFSEDAIGQPVPSIDKGPVVFSSLSPGTMSSHAAESFMNLAMQDGRRAEEHRMIVRAGGGTMMVISGPRVAETRSKIVDTFLQDDKFKLAEWLLMVDSDMVFDYTDVLRLYETADVNERPIVGGLCFAGITPESMYPTVYNLARVDGKIDCGPIRDYPVDSVVKVGATGGAFLLVHRRVLLQMLQPHPTGFGTHPNGTPNIYPWFVEGHVDKDGRPFGEDIAFCIRANALDIPVHVDTRAKIGHHKSVILDEDRYQRNHA